MENKPAIALVILNWNGASLLRQFLPSVLSHTKEEGVTIHVADNGSTDGSADLLKDHFPEVHLLELGKNYGFAGGYNRALARIRADVYVLLNSDVEVTPGWLQPCRERLAEHPRIAALQPKIRSLTRRNHFEYAGAAGGFLDRWGYPFCRGRILSETEEDRGQYNQAIPLFWASGACLFIRSDAFHQAGGFDEDFFAHMEEIDLCWRLKNQGWQIFSEPGSVVYHLGGATLSYQSPRKVFLNFRNSLWMLLKNLPEGKLLPVLLPRMILDGIAAAQFLVSGQMTAFWAVWNAHMNFYRTLPRFLRKRKELLPRVKKTGHPEIFRGSMIWNFYIRRQRHFSLFKFDPPQEP